MKQSELHETKTRAPSPLFKFFFIEIINIPFLSILLVKLFRNVTEVNFGSYISLINLEAALYFKRFGCPNQRSFLSFLLYWSHDNTTECITHTTHKGSCKFYMTMCWGGASDKQRGIEVLKVWVILSFVLL